KTEIVAGKSINIDLSGNSAGVYFVRIKTANSEQVRKIVIR
nr:T9SS type A sorting domain-containing protein [Bacteroidota bacterium]